MLKVVLLVACACIAIGTVLYFFFWNRILGYILGGVLRFVLWTQDRSSTWVEFGSVHLSLIAGRIILRDVRYHSSNQTFRIVKCQLSWRWWLRNVAEGRDLAEGNVDEAEHTQGGKFASRCRIHISMEGFEWFMYNRMAAFENILSQLSSPNPELSGVRTKSRESNSLSLNRSPLVPNAVRSRGSLIAVGKRVLVVFHRPSFVDKILAWASRQLPDLNPNNLLPLSFDAVKGSITLGNHTTESILMAQYARAIGTFGIVESRSILDKHKQLLRVTFKNALINCMENPDYWDSGHNIGKNVKECFSRSDPVSLGAIPLAYCDFTKLWPRCRKLFYYYKSRGGRYTKEQKRKGKEKRTHEEISHVGADFSQLEYALDRRLLETPLLDLVYYADVAGCVPHKSTPSEGALRGEASQSKGPEFMNIGNGDLPPEWGVDVVVHGGSIHYGPWMDRQRAQLQRVFFPQTFQPQVPTTKLSAGDQRTCTCLKLFFEFKEPTNVLLPFREASKNWQWDGLVDITRLRKQREAASIQLRFGDKSTLKYLVPMIATAQGYIAELEVFMDSISVTSSLNDIRLLEADSCSVSSLLPSPLQWNADRCWDFVISLDHLTLYIIRDHINMLTDLGKDWASGPPHDFNTFVPMTYNLNLILRDYELNLYANDHNIIDRPLDRRENVLFTLRGDTLESAISVPSTAFRPLSTDVSFSISSPDVTLSMSLPRWNTHALLTYTIRSLSKIGKVKFLQLNGSYAYCSEVRKDYIDRLKLNVELVSPSLRLLGWMIRHVMVLRENYFGGFTQYSTTREYLNKREAGIPVGDPLDLKYRSGKSNVFHFDLSLTVRHWTVVLPAGIVGFERAASQFTEDIDIGSCIVVTIPELQVLLRLHDFAMEMSLNSDPAAISISDSCFESSLFSYALEPCERQLSISGVNITANRLFGPQPHTSTYVCIWNISAGSVKGSLNTKDAEKLAAAGRCFGHGFVDPFNAPSSDYVIAAEHDATFWNVNIDSLDVSWKTNSAVFRFDLEQGLRFVFNNIAGASYSKLVSLTVPVAELQLLLPSSTTKYWIEAGRIRTGLSAELLLAPKNWRNDAEKQRAFLQKQDAETHRFATLFENQKVKWPGGIYSQGVRAPRTRSPSKRRIRQSATLSVGGRRPEFDILNESESDSERQLTEADRDKRLANSRPRHHVFLSDQRGDGNSSSPLDESDETDGGSSNDSWSDYCDFGENGHVSSRLSYMPFCRKVMLYRTYTDATCRTNFIAGKETPSMQSDLFMDEPLISKDTDETSIPVIQSHLSKTDTKDNKSRRYLRLDVKDTGVFVTALCILTGKEILAQLEWDELSPELRLDELMLQQTTEVTEDPVSVYDVRIRSVGFCTVQDAADLTRAKPSKDPVSDDHHSFIVTKMRLKEVRLLFGLIPSETSGTLLDHGKISIGHIAGSLGSLHTPRRYSKCDPQALSLAIEFSVVGFLSIFSKPQFQVTCDVSESKLHRTAPEVSIVTVTALQEPVKDLLEAQKKLSSLIRLRRKKLICSILTRGTSMSKDLLSSVQPAFFVQSGRPHQLRGDNSWKLLFHLRHCLSEMEKEEYDALLCDLNTLSTVVDIDELLQTRQVPWVMEEAMPLARIGLIESLLYERADGSDATSERNDSKPVIFGGLQAKSLRLIIGYDDLPQSSFVINDVRIRADMLRRRVLFEAASLSPYSSTIRSLQPTSDYVDYGNLSVVLVLDVDSLQITVFPGIIGFLQNVVHVWRILAPSTESEVPSADEPDRTRKPLLDDFLNNRVAAFDVRLVLNHMLLEAAAENIVFEVTSEHYSSFFVSHLTNPQDSPSLDVSINDTISFREFAVKARTRSFVDGDMDTLASITLVGGVWCLLFQNHTPHGSTLRGTLHATSLDLGIPKSAIRLYKFIEQWRQDYLVGLDAMLRSLFTEIRQTPERSSRQPSAKKRLGVHLNVSLSAASVVLQVMHGTWLAWTTYGVLGYLVDRSSPKNVSRSCGLRLLAQVIRVTSTSADWSSQRVPKIVLDLPSISASGSFSPERNGFLISVGFLEVKIKPEHWDSLLSVQQKFGQDFNDFLLIVEDARSKLPGSGRRKKPSSMNPSVPFHVSARFEGFKIGLQGPSSTQFLECVDIDAMVRKKGSPHWHVNLTDLALYLSPRTLSRQKLAEVDRTELPALVSVDVQVSNHTSVQDGHRSLGINVTKFHAILQARLMGIIGDFVDNLQSEVMLRKERRAAELKEFKEKAMKVMKTFNLDPRRSSMVKRDNILDNSSVSILMANFGAVFPLDLERRKMTSMGSGGRITTKALLLSIKSFQFETQRGQSGDAVMEGFCLQFVSRFDPSNPDDFTARRHHTLNQMLYPDMTARVRTGTSSMARHILASASVSGFILDLDPSITSYVFSLVDVYRRGRQGVEHLAVGIPRSTIEAGSVAVQKASGTTSNNVITSRIDASLEFMSGTVRMHCTSKDSSAFSSISPDWSGNTYQILDADAEIFNLPRLSVSAEYNADVRQLGTSSNHDGRSPVLIIRGTIHSSRNALRPLVLSFVSGVVHNVEERMRHEARVVTRSPTGIRRSLSTLSVGESEAGTSKLENIKSPSLRLFISLRIDKSRLELTCRPDVNVIAGVNWESGGFVLSMGSGAKGVSVSASIEGLTIGLKHGFLSDDSAHFDARNLLFSINFSKTTSSPRNLINSISVVVDTEFSGGLRFSRFQDLLCFKAVWLDHIPIIKGDMTETDTSPRTLGAVSPLESSSKQGFDTAVLIHIRRIALEVDLGQSISNVSFDLQTALNRVRLTPARSEISVSFASVDMQARGNLSGHLKMPDFAFRSVRRRQTSTIENQSLSRMLELNLTSGTLDIQLQSDWLWLLRYRAEPLEATIYDDWSIDSSPSGTQKRQLHLYSSVVGSKVVAMMTIMAIPKLMMYGGKIRSNLEAQRDGASRESSAFRSTRLPKPDNALSEVANAMFRSARTKLKETESLSYVINQHMKLQLGELVFVLLPRSQGDTELARIIGRDVMAQLDRTVQNINLPAHRDLRLSLSYLSISQLIKQGFDPRLSGPDFDALTANSRSFPGTENAIFSLPAMDMRMVTDEGTENGTKILRYKFFSRFTHPDGQRGEDIHISFNIRLYSWLTVLRKTFTRELKRVTEAGDSKAAGSSPSNIVAPKSTSPDNTSSPFGIDNDEATSPPGSPPPSRHPSRPSSPVRTRSRDSVIVGTPIRGLDAPVTLTPKKFTLSDASKPAEGAAESGASKSPPGDFAGGSNHQATTGKKSQEITYVARARKIERLTVKQLGEATPDVMHPFFTKKAGFNLEESLPQYVHEYATSPIEEIMKGLVKLYSKQLD